MPFDLSKGFLLPDKQSGVEATPHSDRSSVSFDTRVRRSYAWVWIMEQKDILTWPCVRLCTKTESVQVQVGSDCVKLQNPLQRQHVAKMSLFRAFCLFFRWNETRRAWPWNHMNTRLDRCAGKANMTPALQLAGPRHTISCYQRSHSLPPSLFRRNETHGVSANICTQRTTQTHEMLFFFFFPQGLCIESFASVSRLAGACRRLPLPPALPTST